MITGPLLDNYNPWHMQPDHAFQRTFEQRMREAEERAAFAIGYKPPATPPPEPIPWLAAPKPPQERGTPFTSVRRAVLWLVWTLALLAAVRQVFFAEEPPHYPKQGYGAQVRR